MTHQPIASRKEHHRFLGGQLHREFLIRHRRFCPCCLGETAYHRAEWDFALLAVCPRHAVQILEKCPRCERRLQWKHPDISKCVCGQPLADARPVIASSADTMAATRILDIATGGECRWLPLVLRACDGADLVRATMRFGMYLTGWRQRHSADTLISATPTQLAAIISKGTECLADCPERLQPFVQARLRTDVRRPGRYVRLDAPEDFNSWLASQIEDGT